MKDLSARALNLAQMRGATYADVRLVVCTTQRIAVRNGRVVILEQKEVQGFGVRVLADGAWGFASSCRDEYAEVDATVERALALARAGALANTWEARLGAPEAHKGAYRSHYQLDPFMVTMADKVNLLLKADEAMRRMARRGVQLITSGEMVFVRQDKTFASTEGALIQQEIIESGCEIRAVALTEDQVQTRTYPWGRHQQTRGFECVLEQRLVEHAPRVAEEALRLLSAEPCPALDATTLILSGNQVALQLHETCGHALELDRVLGHDAAFAGTFLTPERLNQFQFGAEIVNVTADATLPGGLGTFGFDDEGVPAQRIELIKDGRFVAYLTSRATAQALGLGRSNGAMRAESWNHPPLVRMTNLNLLPGTWTLDDLIADTDEGFYFDTARSWSIDDKRLNFQCSCELGWEIKGGKRVRLVKNPVYTGLTPTFWRSCDAIGDKSHWALWSIPLCRKGQPPQTVGVGHGAAPARFRKVKVFSTG